MNIIEAIKSGKRYRRIGEREWFESAAIEIDYCFSVRSVVANDWEIEPKDVTITREQFDQAYVRAVAKLPSNSTTNVLIDMIADELGL